jgi:dimethylargininase
MKECQLTFVAPEPIDWNRATQQHHGYCQMLRNCGTEILNLEGNLDFPDCVFIEDTAVVLDEVAVLASMGTLSRKQEPLNIEAKLKEHRSVERVEWPATLEGGDVLRVGRRLLVGISSRTNRAGITAFEKIVRKYGYEVLPVPVGDCLHLKTGCTALPDEALLVNSEWIDVRVLENFELIPVPKAEPWGANVLLLENHVCLAAAHPQTAEVIRKRGLQTCAVDISEFAKAEGGVTCLSVLIP